MEESFRNVITKMFGTDENYDVIINPDKGDFEIYRNRTVVETISLKTRTWKFHSQKQKNRWRLWSRRRSNRYGWLSEFWSSGYSYTAPDAFIKNPGTSKRQCFQQIQRKSRSDCKRRTLPDMEKRNAVDRWWRQWTLLTEIRTNPYRFLPQRRHCTRRSGKWLKIKITTLK